MLFIHPMWDHESERLGKKKCTAAGYALHTVADLIGFIGLILLLCVFVFLVYKGITGGFRASFWWLFAVPFGMGFISEILFRVSWSIAGRRGFEYDPETCIASWKEDGKQVTYTWEPDASSDDNTGP